jgi:hypothetical protein
MMSEDFSAAVSPKSRPKFYFEKERPSFHTAWTSNGHGQLIRDFRAARAFEGAMFRRSRCHQPEF